MSLASPRLHSVKRQSALPRRRLIQTPYNWGAILYLYRGGVGRGGGVGRVLGIGVLRGVGVVRGVAVGVEVGVGAGFASMN
jgi:hypothetical protein